MTPMEFADTPRLYTALAEWGACFLYIIMAKRKLNGWKLWISSALTLVLFILYQSLAGILPLYLWIAGLGGSIYLMYLYLHMSTDLNSIDSWFLCTRAFVLAEFSASLGWQIYVWYSSKYRIVGSNTDSIIMLTSYLFIYSIYFFLEESHIPRNDHLQVGLKEVTGSLSIALGGFAMSNLIFMAIDTPFSTNTNSILYVRTLIDFGGLVMLFAQQDKREEFRMKSENQAMNTVLQRQYDQYRLAQDNIDLLKREFHDMKHYLIAIRSETDPTKREHYLAELEQAIMMQEALTDTGNKVLDVVLTTKSSYCIQKKITFSCMADGKLVNFMDVKDICSIFGNAMDNAIECVEKYEDLEKRVINLSMYQKNQLLMIQVENYLENELILDDALPKTTKKNKSYHGYGLKSIHLAAEKYNGSMTIQGKDNWFTLQILIPVEIIS